MHLSKTELEAKLSQVRDNHQRLYDQFQQRVDTQHSQLLRTKGRAAKLQKQLDSKQVECDDLKLALHKALAAPELGGGGGGGVGVGHQQHHPLPQRASRPVFR